MRHNVGIASQGFRPELMTKDASGAKLLVAEAALGTAPHVHRVPLPIYIRVY